MTRHLTAAPDAATAAWERDVARRAAARLEEQRPAVYACPGQLDPRIIAWADRVAAGEFVNLFLYGEVGRTKTWSCWAAAIRLVAAGFTGAVTMVDALELRERVNRDVDYPWLHRLAVAGLLVLDDLGMFGDPDDQDVVRLSRVQEKHLGGVMHRRWEQHRPTIITSNENNLRALLGERTASRVAASVIPVPMDGPDRRRVKVAGA